MKTNFQKISGRWVVPTGKVVAVDYVNLGDDYDVFLGDQYIDVCTGETFAKEMDYAISEAIGETVWRLVKHYDEIPEYNIRHKANKKTFRKSRINDMVGVHWSPVTDIKQMGKNRFLRRRMMPNKQQQAEYDDYLPF